jgi:hypothetical protein
MACDYLAPNGQKDPVLTETLQYVEDTASKDRTPEFIMGVLDNNGFTMELGEGQPVLVVDMQDEGIAAIKNINDGARRYFGAPSDLIKLRQAGNIYHVEVDSSVLKGMELKDDASLNESYPGESNPKVTEGTEVEEESEVGSGLAERQSFMEETTKMLILNLQKQIDRLERTPGEGVNKRQRLAEMNVLKKQLQRIEYEKANLDDYMDFVRFVEGVATRAKTLVAKINDTYTDNYENTSQEERAKMLKDLTELKKTIDAFYNDNNSRSLVNNLQNLIAGLDDVQEDLDETVVILQEAASDMANINNEFLETGLEIQVDYLLSFAPPEINVQLDQKIAGIRESRRLDGINRFDPRYLKARRDGLDALIDLNIQQLEEKKIGRESILKELRQTHRDQSRISAFFSPVVYSKDTTIKLFAEAVRKALVDARQETLDYKYDVLQDAFREYVDSQGVGQDNVQRLYDPITETITITVFDEEGNRKDVKTVAFVQEYDINRFNLAKAQAWEKFRKDYNFPTDPTQYDEYFKSDVGKAYLAATAQWYAENTEEVDGAQGEIARLRELRDSIFAQIKEKKEQMDSDELQALYLQYSDVKYTLLKVSRGGRAIGKLSKPKMSLYENPKFKRMTEAQRKFYDTVLAQYKADQKKLGSNGLRRNSWDDFSYILPGIRKDARDQFLEDGVSQTTKNLYEDRVKKEETDTEFGQLLDANGEKIKLIPQYFTGLVDVSKISRDVTNSMIKFHDMSNRYKAKSDIVGVVNMMEVAIGSRQQVTMTPTGDYVKDRTAQRLGINLDAGSSGEDSHTMRQLRSFIDNVVYGISEEELNSRLNAMDGLSANKLSQFAISMTAFSTLSLNWLQAGNQLILDTMSGTQEAVGGEFYSTGNLAYARSKMYFLGGGLGLMNDKFLPDFGKKNKVAKFLEYFDAFQDFGNEFGTEAGSRVKKAMHRGAGFVFQQTAEMMTVGERALALADSYRGKIFDKKGNVMLNSEGKPANLFEVMQETETGKLVLDPNVATEGPNAFDQRAFIAKLHGMMKRTNQLKGNFDRVHAQRHSYWKLATLFRNYLVPGLRKRFGSFDGAMVDVEMGSVNEGYYATFLNELSNGYFDIKEGKVGAAFKRLTPGIFSRNKNTTTKQNMRRLYYELMAAQIATLLAAALSDIMGDDDDDSYVGHFVNYQLLRLRSEWAQFRSPELFSVLRDPTAVANPVIHLSEAIVAIKDYAGYKAGLVDAEDVFYQRRAGQWEKGDAKVVKEILDFAPLLRGAFTSSDPEEAARYYDMKQ